jgi:[acyl-carrier-protein] S-malonyltransferase
MKQGASMSKLAFVFPGQGSQATGMLEEMAVENMLIQSVYNDASEVLGYDLWDLVLQNPEDKLNQTEYTQPALLAGSIALWRIWLDNNGRQPDYVAGHSLGEYSALVAAGVINYQDAVGLVQKRGRFMQQAVPVGEGGMAAILGLDDNDVVEICRQCSGEEVVQAANFNSPGQVVIAGHMAALERAIQGCQEAGARRAMQLTVSAPFHSELMKPAAEAMTAELEAIPFQIPNIPIIQNVHAQIELNPDKIKQNLIGQICSAVKWTDTVQLLSSDGVDKVVECGPGKILTGLIKRIDRSIESLLISDAESLHQTLSNT